MEEYPNVNWPEAVKPLLKKYKNEKHPLAYKNTYQLMVMVVLSAQDSDRHINKIAPMLFEAFSDMTALSKATEKSLHSHISDVRNSDKKAQWLLKIAQTIKADKNIPYSLDALTDLPGIGRKSANVILRESGKEPEGIMVDLHTVRVAPRLGIASGTDPKKIEKTNDGSVAKKRMGCRNGNVFFRKRNLQANAQMRRMLNEACLQIL